MLLLEKPMRLSTDIDILLEPGTDIDHFLTEAAQIFPFVSCQESVRKTAKSIEKRHFRFQYVSLFDSTKTADILLDCVFVKNPYSQLAEREIKNEFLLTEGDNLTVRIPTIEAILGDKLTAFAPHTIGVVFHNEDFSNDKRLEVVKQFYDVSILSGQAKDFNAVRENYFSVAKEELAFRGLSKTPEECLKDTFWSAFIIVTRGTTSPEDYAENYLPGIRKIRDHIYGESFSAESAVAHAANVMLLTAGILANEDVLNTKVPNFDNFKDKAYSKTNYLNTGRFKEIFNKAAYAISLFDRFKH